ncbi:outer membrane protein assembly factor BamE [Actibacterium sp. 188UL27-1]|uniref:outer membrane protein assembly factor BamE n=1 Tax=Actibacterium sp. 188UL27-1 TaxID=2786961 RepID=UPI0019579B3B|nr:outer membrane protein assembly factor BamE [Actibacterium sp. 188UL27-1]MBM7067311.1 outer membrane protein assembly factor BamE [Actibacterium sp. 188UL27-1]
MAFIGTRILRSVVLILCVAAVTACTPLYRTHGYTPTDQDLAKITVGVDTKDTVDEVIGAPSSSGVLRDSGYYYVEQRIKKFAYQEPEVVDRQVVAITFQPNGVVRNVERFGLQDGNIVALSRRVTDSNVEGLSFLRQLFGNIGRFNTGSIFDD